MSQPNTSPLKKPKNRKLKTKKTMKTAKDMLTVSAPKPSVTVSLTHEVMEKKHPQLPAKLTAVHLTNNQKGRIRQVIRDKLKGVPEQSLPDILHRKIIHILDSSEVLTDSDLRKIRVLYNMYKSAMAKKYQIEEDSKAELKLPMIEEENLSPVKKLKKEKKKGKGKGDGPIENVNEKALHTSPALTKIKEVPKVKGPKRYTVFIGDLPPDIDKEQIAKHFAELGTHIVSIRIPKRAEGQKSAIAYLELKDELTYEMALSKHHTMLRNKRIKVLYTTQKKTKIYKAEAKSKSAKLIAMNKSGKLVGSVPQGKKRSARRKKMKLAQAKENLLTRN